MWKGKITNVYRKEIGKFENSSSVCETIFGDEMSKISFFAFVIIFVDVLTWKFQEFPLWWKKIFVTCYENIISLQNTHSNLSLNGSRKEKFVMDFLCSKINILIYAKNIVLRLHRNWKIHKRTFNVYLLPKLCERSVGDAGRWKGGRKMKMSLKSIEYWLF